MSANDLMLDVSQAAELKLAFRRNGWNNAEIKTLSEGDILADVLKVVKGQAEIKIAKHLIDCDSAPLILNRWLVEEHKKSGFFKFDPAKISLYLSKKQGKGKVVIGNDLRKELGEKFVLNANVLDYLLAHPDLIPKKWKGKSVIFWGTIYRGFSGTLFVRCLRWGSSEWKWAIHWLDSGLDLDSPAAIAS